MRDNFDLTDPKQLRDFLKKHGVWTKKKFGQNFLVSRESLNTIVEESDIKKGELVVEVGPGHGVLTRELLNAQAKMEVIEIDDTIIPALKSSTRPWKDYIDIFQMHVLDFEIPEKPYKFIANIPYHLTSPILRKFLIDTTHRPQKIVILVQKEVAEKVCAKKDKDSLFSIMVKTFGEPKYVQTVKAEAFFPPPKVDSAILAIDPYEKPLIDIPSKIYFEMLFNGFKEPRKKLKNVLMKRYFKTEKQVQDIFETVEIDIDARAQNVTIPQWELLTKAFYPEFFVKKDA